jgi:hypothetical protein
MHYAVVAFVPFEVEMAAYQQKSGVHSSAEVGGGLAEEVAVIEAAEAERRNQDGS